MGTQSFLFCSPNRNGIVECVTNDVGRSLFNYVLHVDS